jgi:hypothetical protein
VLVVTTYMYLCVYHLLPNVLSYNTMPFCGFVGLMVLFMAVCLTLDYFVLLYGSVIP